MKVILSLRERYLGRKAVDTVNPTGVTKSYPPRETAALAFMAGKLSLICLNIMKLKVNLLLKSGKDRNLFSNLYFRISKSRFDSSQINVATFRNRGKMMAPHLLRSGYIIAGRVTPYQVKIIKTYLKQLCWLEKNGGIPAVVKYLKVCSVLVQQVSAGYYVPDLGPLGMRVSRDHTGYPKLIPLAERCRLRKGNKVVLRRWLTLLSLYRDLTFAGKLKLSTITQGPTTCPDQRYLSSGLDSFISLLSTKEVPFSKENYPFQILKSGPHTRGGDPLSFNSSVDSIVNSKRAFYLPQSGSIRSSLLALMDLTNSDPVKRL